MLLVYSRKLAGVGGCWGGWGQSSVRGESGGRKLIQDGVRSWSGTEERDESITCLPGKESLHNILRLP